MIEVLKMGECIMLYTITCPCCKSTLRFINGDETGTSDTRYINCPVCGMTIITRKYLNDFEIVNYRRLFKEE